MTVDLLFRGGARAAARVEVPVVVRVAGRELVANGPELALRQPISTSCAPRSR